MLFSSTFWWFLSLILFMEALVWLLACCTILHHLHHCTISYIMHIRCRQTDLNNKLIYKKFNVSRLLASQWSVWQFNTGINLHVSLALMPTLACSWVHLIVISWGSRSLKINILAGIIVDLQTWHADLVCQHKYIVCSCSHSPPRMHVPLTSVYIRIVIKWCWIQWFHIKHTKYIVWGKKIPSKLWRVWSWIFDLTSTLTLTYIPTFNSVCCSYTSSWLLSCCYLSELYRKRDG